jgi:hypothetical protein
MARSVRVAVLLGTAAIVAVIAMLVVPGIGQEAVAAEEEDRCCFNNQRFTGTCVVVPAEDETCADILSYLNNPNSVGKAYCGNTKVRMGWKQVECAQ